MKELPIQLRTKVIYECPVLGDLMLVDLSELDIVDDCGVDVEVLCVCGIYHTLQSDK